MEPSALITKWEPYLQHLQTSSDATEIVKGLSKIDRKIDSLADEILNSPAMLILLQHCLESVSLYSWKDPHIRSLGLSIINSLNTRQPNLIALPKQLIPNVSLKSVSTECQQIVLDLQSLNTNFADNTQKIRSFHRLFAKGVVQITDPEHRSIFLKYAAIMLNEMNKWDCFLDANYLDTLNIVIFAIEQTDLKIPFYLINGLLSQKGNDIVWRYALRNAYLDHCAPFETMKRDIVAIHSILNVDSISMSGLRAYLCDFLAHLSQLLPQGMHDFLRLLEFYHFLRESHVPITIMEIESLLNDVIPLEFKKGPVFLRKYQLELLHKNVQFDEKTHTTLSRKQFRLMIRYVYQINREDIQHIAINDAITLLELAFFFKDPNLQIEMEKRITSYLDQLPKNTFGLYTEGGFNKAVETIFRLAKLNLITKESKYYLSMWPPIPKRGSELEKGMLFDPHGADLFAMYMRQLGMLYWLISHFMPEERAHPEFTKLNVVNSYIAYQIRDVFWANSTSTIDIDKTATLLHCIRRGMEEPVHLGLDFDRRVKLKPINPFTLKPCTSLEKIRLDVTHYTNSNLSTFLGLLRSLPIGDIILSHSLPSLQEVLIKNYFPGVNLITRGSDESNQT